MEVFGVPPIDPNALVEPAVEAVRPAASEATMEPSVAATDDSLFGWLRRVMGGDSAPESEPAVIEPALTSTVMVTLAPVLAALPTEEIEARLIERVSVGEDLLMELAVKRGHAVHRHLNEAGIGFDRLREAPIETEGAGVRLDLR
ncbi:MAG: hypothetical protein J6386_14135 [Candidatus Synoicihabitans palmerolidicus]|nr:hypothetical protein [Candidatus Synoicihabitans palmerolidicus]